jgi:hypothetical protein
MIDGVKTKESKSSQTTNNHYFSNSIGYSLLNALPTNSHEVPLQQIHRRKSLLH